MTGAIVAGAAYSLLLSVLSFLKPNAGRIFLGIFFLVMGIGVNGSFLLTQPTFVYDYGHSAHLSLYRTLAESIIAPAPMVFGILLIFFEVTMGTFLLSSGRWVKAGLIGTMAFVLMLVPIHYAQAVWAVSIVANIYLLTRRFDASVVMIFRNRK